MKGCLQSEEIKEAGKCYRIFSLTNSRDSFVWLAFLLDSSVRFKIRLICIGIVTELTSVLLLCKQVYM